MQAGTHTWGDCWACKFGKAESDTCISMGVPESVCQGLEHCQPPRAHMSYYAPQIAWWLAFFPPERFLIFTSDEINDPEQQIKVRASRHFHAWCRHGHASRTHTGDVLAVHCPRACTSPRASRWPACASAFPAERSRGGRCG